MKKQTFIILASFFTTLSITSAEKSNAINSSEKRPCALLLAYEDDKPLNAKPTVNTSCETLTAKEAEEGEYLNFGAEKTEVKKS